MEPGKLAAILDTPVISQIATRLLDLADRRRPEERVRDVMFRLTPDNAPALFAQESFEDRELSWQMLETLERVGCLLISRPKRARTVATLLESKLQVRLLPAGEDMLREHFGRPLPGASYAARWRAAVLGLAVRPGGDLEPLSRCPIEVAGRHLDEVLDGVARLLSMPAGLYPREASARAFWGMSKLLDSDNRLAAVNTARGELGALSPSPILLNVSVPSSGLPSGILFIENEATYHRVVDSRKLVGDGQLAIIWTAGFKGSSARMRRPEHLRIHGLLASSHDGLMWVEQQLAEGDGEGCWFFGDLDYAGLAILGQLRATYPRLEAWVEGYRVLLESLTAGAGHLPDETGKERQRDVGPVGCSFADGELRAGITRTGRFVDQEVWSPDMTAGPGV